MAKIKVIYGAPCSGKSTMVKKMLKDKDARFDYDLILEAITNKKLHQYSKIHLPLVMEIRKLLACKVNNYQGIENFYIITTKITDKLQSELSGMEVEYLLNSKSKEECYNMLDNDDSREDKEFWRGKIDEWFEWLENFQLQSKEKTCGRMGVNIIDSITFKAAGVLKQQTTENDLSLINKYTLRELTAEEVFTFKIAVCDNKIDRDFEVFPIASLNELAKLFVGKTIISNHQHMAENQCARIYNTTVEKLQETTTTGEAYSRLIAYCYMVRTDSTKDLVTEIEAGIKKEVSVGCMVEKIVCSICGTDNRKAYCKHWAGKEYDGQKCYFRLESPSDAYEVSFVAVPAQPNAGTTKSFILEKKEHEKHIVLKAKVKQAEIFSFLQMEESANE